MITARPLALALALALLLPVAACGKDKAASAPKVEMTQADVDAVNALVPSDLKATVEFELRTGTEERGRKKQTYTFVAPKGWKEGFTTGSVEPTKSGWPKDEDSFGMGRTKLWVMQTCDGACQPKDWAASADKHQFSRLTGGEAKGKILKDEKTATGRLVVFQEVPTVTETKTETGTQTSTSGSNTIHVVRATWAQGASNYHVCVAELVEPAHALLPAFEKACEKFAVTGG